MSLQPQPIGPVPAMTALVARAAFPKGHRLLRLRDTLGTIYDDATGVAITLQRLDDWWTETPRAVSRPSRFAALAA
jgi:hypothetical protein